eukprot:5318503-Pleurochrysis_carterae.AAC.1
MGSLGAAMRHDCPRLYLQFSFHSAVPKLSLDLTQDKQFVALEIYQCWMYPYWQSVGNGMSPYMYGGPKRIYTPDGRHHP